MTLMTCSCFSVVDFEHINVGGVMSILLINNIVHKSQIYKFIWLKTVLLLLTSPSLIIIWDNYCKLIKMLAFLNIFRNVFLWHYFMFGKKNYNLSRRNLTLDINFLERTLHEKCPNREISGPYSVRMRINMDQKKLRIWTLFTQWNSLLLWRFLFKSY